MKCRIEDTHTYVGIFNRDPPQNCIGQIAFISLLDSQNQISYQWASKDGEVDQGDPGLVVHIELLEGQAPGVFDDDPGEDVKDDGDPRPNGAGDQ